MPPWNTQRLRTNRITVTAADEELEQLRAAAAGHPRGLGGYLLDAGLERAPAATRPLDPTLVAAIREAMGAAPGDELERLRAFRTRVQLAVSDETKTTAEIVRAIEDALQAV